MAQQIPSELKQFGTISRATANADPGDAVSVGFDAFTDSFVLAVVKVDYETVLVRVEHADGTAYAVEEASVAEPSVLDAISEVVSLALARYVRLTRRWTPSAA